MPPVESILKELQTPQIIRDFPCFTGDPEQLNTFIKALVTYSNYLKLVAYKNFMEAYHILSLY